MEVDDAGQHFARTDEGLEVTALQLLALLVYDLDISPLNFHASAFKYFGS